MEAIVSHMKSCSNASPNLFFESIYLQKIFWSTLELSLRHSKSLLHWKTVITEKIPKLLFVRGLNCRKNITDKPLIASLLLSLNWHKTSKSGRKVHEKTYFRATRWKHMKDSFSFGRQECASEFMDALLQIVYNEHYENKKRFKETFGLRIKLKGLY